MTKLNATEVGDAGGRQGMGKKYYTAPTNCHLRPKVLKQAIIGKNDSTRLIVACKGTNRKQVDRKLQNVEDIIKNKGWIKLNIATTHNDNKGTMAIETDDCLSQINKDKNKAWLLVMWEAP